MKTLSRIYVYTTSGSSFYDNAGEKRVIRNMNEAGSMDFLGYTDPLRI